MKKLIAGSITLLSTSVLAHEGYHGHPHGIEGAYAILGLALVGVIVYAINRYTNKK